MTTAERHAVGEAKAEDRLKHAMRADTAAARRREQRREAEAEISAPKSFNFARAWREVAEPAFRLLPADVLELFVDVSVAYKDTHQMNNLEMPWLDGFRERFDALDTATLAHASRAAYFFGHWSPNGDSAKTAGGTWKFSNLCDQVITERLWPGMPHIRPHSDNGKAPVSYKVLEGAIRLQLSRDTRHGNGDYWMWREVGYASAELLAALWATNPHADRDPDAELDRVQNTPEVAVQVAAGASPAEPWARLLNTGDKFMDEQFPCVACGTPDPTKYRYGMFYTSELCERGECGRCCTCYLLDVDHSILRAELLETEAAKLEERNGEELRRVVHQLRSKGKVQP